MGGYVPFNKGIAPSNLGAINTQQTSRNTAMAAYAQQVLQALMGQTPGATMTAQPGTNNASYVAPNTNMLQNPTGQEYGLTLSNYDTMRDPAAAARQAAAQWGWEREDALRPDNPGPAVGASPLAAPPPAAPARQSALQIPRPPATPTRPRVQQPPIGSTSGFGASLAPAAGPGRAAGQGTAPGAQLQMLMPLLLRMLQSRGGVR